MHQDVEQSPDEAGVAVHAAVDQAVEAVAAHGAVAGADQRDQAGADRLVAGQHPGRSVTHARDQVGVAGDPGEQLGVPAPLGRERVEVDVLPLGPGEVHVGVQDEPSDPPRIGVGVPAAEPGAVGVADEVQPLGAEQGPDELHVEHRLLAADELAELGRRTRVRHQTGLGPLCPVRLRRPLPIVRRGGQRAQLLGGGEALQPGGHTEAAGIEADQVEVGEQLLLAQGQRDGQGQADASRATRVGHHQPGGDPGRPAVSDGHPDVGMGVGVVPVHRGRDGGTVRGRRLGVDLFDLGVEGTRRPGDLLVQVARWDPRSRGVGRRRTCSGRRADECGREQTEGDPGAEQCSERSLTAGGCGIAHPGHEHGHLHVIDRHVSTVHDGAGRPHP